MSDRLPRRQFLQSAAALGLGAGLGPWEALRGITPATADEAKVGPEMVRFRPEIEPVVRWIEDTPREQVFEKAVAELKAGLSYRELLAGLFLAGIRNIKPRPVGFKFHAVMVINSAHLLGQTSAVTERLLPLFWALDNFKSSQAADVKEGDWALGQVDESHVPPPHRAGAEYLKAMDAWDAEAADAAVAGLCRGSGAAETMEPIWRMAVRDQRNIGHKPIFAAQSWRTLQAIGWEHAEPVLRSLTYGLLDLQGDRPKPLGPFEANLEAAKKIRADWPVGRVDSGATTALAPDDPPCHAGGRVGRGREDARSGRRAGLALGCRHALGQRADDEQPRHHRHPRHDRVELAALHLPRQRRRPHPTARPAPGRRLAADVPRSRQARQARRDQHTFTVDDKITDGAEAVGEIFATINQDRGQAAAKTLAYLAKGGSTAHLFDAARRMIFHKGTDSHDYKYGAAIWEECLAASDPRWRAPLAAAAMFNLPGAKTGDSPLMIRAT